MRGGRLRYLVGAVVLVVAAVVIVVVSGRGGGAPGRPESGPRWQRLMGDGDVPIHDMGTDPVAALDVRGTGFVGMAAEDDGTLWLLHGDQGLFRLGLDGTLSRRYSPGEPAADAAGALALSPEGYLYAVTDLSRAVSRVDLTEPGSPWEITRLDGLDDPELHGIAVDDDGEIFVADGLGHVYSANPDFDRPGDRTEATLVDRAPGRSEGCAEEGSLQLWQIGISLDDRGELVIADPSCEGIYRLGEAPIPPADERRCDGGHPAPGGAAAVGDRMVVVGYSCRYVWTVSDDNTTEVVLPGGGAQAWRTKAVAIDDTGALYVLDERGVSSFRLPSGD